MRSGSENFLMQLLQITFEVFEMSREFLHRNSSQKFAFLKFWDFRFWRVFLISISVLYHYHIGKAKIQFYGARVIVGKNGTGVWE